VYILFVIVVMFSSHVVKMSQSSWDATQLRGRLITLERQVSLVILFAVTSIFFFPKIFDGYWSTTV